MRMLEKALKVLNEMEKDGLLERYAIGGAMAVLFYSEPILTYDLDVFVFLPSSQKAIVTLDPIYSYLKKKGYKTDKEHILIEGVPVQLIPAYNALVEEAVHEAKTVHYGKIRTRVIPLEYLMAILLQTGRPKDKERLAQMIGKVKTDSGCLSRILKRHGLMEKWKVWRRSENP